MGAAEAGLGELSHGSVAPLCVSRCNIDDLGRTNVVIDDDLIAKAMQLYGFRTKRETIDYALRRLVGRREPRDMLDLEGMGWDGDLAELRRRRPLPEL